jgi:hypothetical protein
MKLNRVKSFVQQLRCWSDSSINYLSWFPVLLFETLFRLTAYTIVYDTTSLAVQPIIERIHRFCSNTAVVASRAF